VLEIGGQQFNLNIQSGGNSITKKAQWLLNNCRAKRGARECIEDGEEGLSNAALKSADPLYPVPFFTILGDRTHH